MSSNMNLTLDMGIRVGPIMLSTLAKHYLATRQEDDSKAKDEFLYDQAFNVVKGFLTSSTKHTVEELQEFSNTKIPSPPWIHTPRVLVPMSCCEQAATHLIQALGGEETAKRIVGGVKWWQVRGLKGVDAQWIMVKKDWRDDKRRRKEQEAKAAKAPPTPKLTETDPEPEYSAEMDEMRCMLYLHGGGYYFGSIDQERYCMQRYARKMNGRVFAVNYRLAPQYPFPCALQDALACYLYLLYPPEGAKHRPVPPSQIVFAGDSAGGGLAIALLQVVRDAGLPLPAGAVLISPWSDLTHSFPSLHQNTKTDVIPDSGLSIHKPSPLWPPPSETMTQVVRKSLTSRIKGVARSGFRNNDEEGQTIAVTARGDTQTVIETLIEGQYTGHARGPSIALPTADGVDADHISIVVDNKMTTIRSQIQLYAPNRLLSHPLISPALGYLGGLPPLFVIASDKEVLRDEIIYLAHKAAQPELYPVLEAARSLYPPYEGIESRYGSTKVHLQVYDETCHVLPLYSFTTPAKFCYRAIATFCKYAMPRNAGGPVLEDAVVAESPIAGASSSLPSRRLSFFGRRNSAIPPPINTRTKSAGGLPSATTPKLTSPFPTRAKSSGALEVTVTALAPPSPILKSRDTSPVRSPIGLAPPLEHESPSDQSDVPGESSDVAGSRFQQDTKPSGQNTAGHPFVYQSGGVFGTDNMIRERVSTVGILRPLEPAAELQALAMDPALVGAINELSVKRYIKAQARSDTKFKSAAEAIERQRQKNLERAKLDTQQAMERLSTVLQKDDEYADRFLNSASWSWAWALAGDENPPPSSIAARRDTVEARRLSKIADESFGEREHPISGNNLWAVIVNSLTAAPKPGAPTTPATPPVEDDALVPTTSTIPGHPPVGPMRTLYRSVSQSRLFRRKATGPAPEVPEVPKQEGVDAQKTRAPVDVSPDGKANALDLPKLRMPEPPSTVTKETLVDTPEQLPTDSPPIMPAPVAVEGKREDIQDGAPDVKLPSPDSSAAK